MRCCRGNNFPESVNDKTMHEVAIVSDMFRIIDEVAKQEQLTRIDKVYFSIGKMLQVVPDLFRFAFDSAKENTIAADAEIEIEFLPVQMRCVDCRYEFEVEGNKFFCPNCEGTNLDLIQGKELLIKSIEGE